MVTGDVRAVASLALGAQRANIPYGRKVRLSGALKKPGGEPLLGEGVQIQALGPTGLRTLARVVTGTGGSFAVNLRLAFNRMLAARFDGNPALRPAQSRSLRIGVRAHVTASSSLAGNRLNVGQRIVISGIVRPRKRTALLLVDRETKDGAYRRILKRPLRTRLGRIRAHHRFKKRGRYRLRLGVDRDLRNLSARSDPVVVNVD
jgi:hypothetical protein